MHITILTDDPQSWFVKFGFKLKELLEERKHDVKYVFDKREIKKGDICFLLSCSRLVEKEWLTLNSNNIVVHASDLPNGKGFSPLQWQILEGHNQIPLTLFEAAEEVDAGPFYIKSRINLDGSELYNELRAKLGDKIVLMSVEYVDCRNILKAKKQTGKETFYPRRKSVDDEIDPNKSIVEQFDHFRIADNDKFPLYFYHLGKRYTIRVDTERKCERR